MKKQYIVTFTFSCFEQIFFHIHIYDVIRNEFYQCLQNDVFAWHNSLLSSKKKRTFAIEFELINWESILIARFKENATIVIKIFFVEVLTMHHVYQKKKSKKYIQIIVRMNKIAHLFFIINFFKCESIWIQNFNCT